MPRTEQFRLDIGQVFEATAPDGVEVTVSNQGPNVCYYDDARTVSAISNDGSLGVGASAAFIPSKFFVSAGHSRLSVTTPTQLEQLEADMDQTSNPAVLLPFTIPGTLTVAAGLARLPIPTSGTIQSIQASVGVAPTGASVIVDVNKNGTTLFATQANRPTIAASAFTSNQVTPDTVALTEGDYLTVDVDQIGSGVAGSTLTVVVWVGAPAPVPEVVPDTGERRRITFVSNTLTLTNMLPGEVEVPGTLLHADLTGTTAYRFSANTLTGFAGGTLKVQYSIDNGASWPDLTSSISIASEALRRVPASDPWSTIPIGARGQILARIVSAGGDSAADPVVSQVVLEARAVA